MARLIVILVLVMGIPVSMRMELVGASKRTGRVGAQSKSFGIAPTSKFGIKRDRIMDLWEELCRHVKETLLKVLIGTVALSAFSIWTVLDYVAQ
jgi:hypothetical protein